MGNFNYQFWIALALENLGLSLLILALIIFLIEWLVQKVVKHATGYEVLYRWVALLPLGVTAIYAFVMHAFFPEFTAKTIGWANSPFQYEVAAANLAFGVIAILSFRASYGFRLATVIGSTLWLWGDAVVHIYEMMTTHNMALGNAGSWLWMDILVPLILIFCIIRMRSQRVATITTPVYPG